jgi:transposase
MSEGIEELARRLVIGHKRDGRSIYDAQAKAELIEICRRGEVSMAKLARDCGVNANQLNSWVRQHERALNARASASTGEVVEAPAAAFVPVQIEETAPAQPACTISLQARLPNGVVLDLRGCDLQHAGQLIDALGRLRCSASTRS